VPLYEYKCLKCGKRSEKIENLKGPFLKKCPHCGGNVERLTVGAGDPVQGQRLVRERLRQIFFGWRHG
jgi:putative FmdB family regulatory protein